MEDVVLKVKLHETTCLYVSPITRQAYDEHVEEDNLGGDNGYFIIRSHTVGAQRLEILAKAPTFEAAGCLFDLIVLGMKQRLIHETNQYSNY
jgi:hypothetical protein